MTRTEFLSRPATLRAAALLTALLLGPGAAQAAGPVDPDWPCIQRRVPQLSLGQVWAGPPEDEAVAARAQEPAIQALAGHIALRRTPLPEAEAAIADFALREDHAPLAMTALYVATFEHINSARSRVMAGITRYAHKQAELDAEIKESRHSFDRLSAADPPDFDAIDAAERKVDWSTRIFLERQQSLIYVCETPVILEQRAFALGRAVMSQLR